MISNIEFIDLINNKTKKISSAGRDLMYKAHRTIVASKGKYKIIKINKMSAVLESAIEKHVKNTYLKMRIPMMWRKLFKNIAENRDYIYNYCKNPYNKFHRYCFEWYMYNKVKNKTLTDDDYNMLKNFNNGSIVFYML